MTNRIAPRAKEAVNEAPQLQASRASRVLVVDDEAVIRFLTANALVYAGYQVDEAKDGDAAWRTLQRNRTTS